MGIGAHITPRSLTQVIRDVWAAREATEVPSLAWANMAGAPPPGILAVAPHKALPLLPAGDVQRPSGTFGNSLIVFGLLCLPHVFLLILSPLTERTHAKGFLGARPHSRHEHMVSSQPLASWGLHTHLGQDNNERAQADGAGSWGLWEHMQNSSSLSLTYLVHDYLALTKCKVSF